MCMFLFQYLGRKYLPFQKMVLTLHSLSGNKLLACSGKYPKREHEYIEVIAIR